MATKTEDEMIIELDESGYECYIWWFPPNDKYTRFEGIESAYAHLQASKRLAVLEDFVREIAATGYAKQAEMSAVTWVEKAQDLLAEKYGSDE